MVPEVEEREAAKFCGYNWREWRDLPRQERVIGFAHFRVHRLIEMNQQDARDKDSNRRMRQRQQSSRSK